MKLYAKTVLSQSLLLYAPAIYFPSMAIWDSSSSSEGAKRYKYNKYPQRAWHYEESKFYMLQAFLTHTYGIIGVQLSPDVLPPTPIFLTHYKQIILLTHPVRQTEPSIICLLLLLKLPNKYFSGFMDGGHFQDSSSGGTSGRRKSFVGGNPVFLPC